MMAEAGWPEIAGRQAVELDALLARIERLRAVAREAHAWVASEEEDEQGAKRALDRLSWAVDALEPGDLDGS